MTSCKQCLFNSSNYPLIKINEEGICDICVINTIRINSIQSKKSESHILSMIELIKSSKKGIYDCLIGISGGTDSSYLVYLAKKWKLNPLLLHVDGGWNSEISVININHIVESSGFDFVTEVVPWDELRDVQRSFVKANVVDIDMPFDNLIMSYNYRTAGKYNIKYILNGYSTETEGIMPLHFAHYKFDKRNIINIHKTWGENKIEKLNFLGTFNYLWYDRIKKIKILAALDWLEYNKAEAKKIIQEQFNWKDYGGKHYENIYTRFYQGYILPKKFSIDKRYSHISMLICCKQINRDQALDILKELPLYPSALLERDDKLFFLKKLKFSEAEFHEYIFSDPVPHQFYKSDLDYYDFFKPLYKLLKKVLRFRTFKI